MNWINYITFFIIGAVFGSILIRFFLKSKNDIELAVIKEKLDAKEKNLLELKIYKDKIKDEKNIEISRLQDLIAKYMADIARLETINMEEKTVYQEKIALINDARKQLKEEFENLGNRIFEEKSLKFTEANRVNINSVIHPLREQLGDFKKKIEYVYDRESRDRVSLFNEISNLKDINKRIGKDAINLTNALKGESKTKGIWGEIVLERVLEESGLHKGREYDIQVSLHDKKGKRYLPDVIIRLPEGKDIVVDSKVSLNAYESFYSASCPNERMQKLKNHIQAMREHIKDLGAKRYQDLKDIHTLDFILMFVPIEAAFFAAMDNDEKLFEDAFKKNIIIVTPSTLLLTLRIIENIWQYEYQGRNSREIAKKAGDLYDKFAGFVESLEDIGKTLDKAKESYNKAYGRLVSGRGNLIKRTEDLKNLGVKTRKKLDRELVEMGDENHKIYYPK